MTVLFCQSSFSISSWYWYFNIMKNVAHLHILLINIWCSMPAFLQHMALI